MKVNLNKVYNPLEGDDDDVVLNPTPKSKGVDVLNIKSPFRWGRGGINSTTIDPNDYTPYIKEPVYVEKLPTLETRRGEGQSVGAKLLHTVPRMVGKTAIQFFEGFGYIPEIFKKDSDYSNDFTRAMQSANAWLDEALPIYRSTEGTFGWNDMGWWLQNAEGLISSIGAFALQGGLMSKTFGAIGKTAQIGKGVKLGTAGLARAAGASNMGALRAGISAAQTGEKLLTAGMLAYTEGAMSGKRVFDNVYQHQYYKHLADGATIEEAKTEAVRIAAESASSTVQISTAMVTGLNMLGGVNMFFNHNKSAVLETAGAKLFGKAGERARSWATRLEGMSGKQFGKELGIRAGGVKSREALIMRGREALGEGLEEMSNQFAERTGIEEGREGNVMGLMEQFGQLDKFADRTFDEEGALNFMLGAIGGLGQGALASSVPLHKIDQGVLTNDKGEMVDKQGNVVETEQEAARKYLEGTGRLEKVLGRVTARTRDNYRTEGQFNDIKSRIQEDALHLAKTEDQIEAAIAKGDNLTAQRLIRGYFNTQNLNSVNLGFAENLAETYKSIAQLDNTKTDTEELEEQLGEVTKQREAIEASKGDTTELDAQIKELETAVSQSQGKTAAQLLEFSAGKFDNTFKDKANKAVTHLQQMQKIYDDTQAEFQTGDPHVNPTQLHVADIIAKRRMELYLHEDWKKELEEKRAKVEAQTPLDGNLTEERKSAIAYDRHYHRAALKLAQAVEDYKVLDKALNNPTEANLDAAKQIAERHGMPFILDGQVGLDNFLRLKNRVAKIANETAKNLKEGDEALFGSEDFKKWQKEQGKEFTDKTERKEKNATFSAYLNELAERRDERPAYDKAIDEAELEIEERKEWLEEVKKARTLTAIQKNVENFFAKILEHENHLNKVAQERRSLRILTDKAKERAYAIRLQQILKSQSKRLANFIEELDTELKTAERLQKELDALNDAKNKDIRLIESTTKGLMLTQERIKDLTDKIDSLYKALDFTTEKMAKKVSPEIKAEAIEVIEKEEEVAEEETAEEEVTEETATEEEEEVTPEEVTPEKTITEDDIKTSATDVYFDHIAGLRNSIKNAVEGERNEILDGKEFSYDALKFYVDNELLTQAEAAKIMQLMADHLKELDVYDGVIEKGIDKAFEAEDTLEAVEELTSKEIPAPKEKIVHDGFPVTPQAVEQSQERDPKYWDGFKQTEPSNSLAIGTVTYVVDETTKAYKKQSTYKLEPGLNLDILNPYADLVGRNIELRIDLEYDGTVQDNTDGESNEKNQEEIPIDMDSLREVNEQGSLMPAFKTDSKSLDLIPIKIVEIIDGEEKVLGYVHRPSWIEATNEGMTGPEKYRNTADETGEGATFLSSNVKKQVAFVNTIRRAVVEAYNVNGQSLPSKITEQGPGMLQFTAEYGRASTRLKGDFEVGVILDGAMQGVNNPEQYTVDTDTRNALVATVPMANGTRSYGFIRPNPMMGDADTSNSTFRNMIRAFELHLTAAENAEEIQSIKDITKNVKNNFTGFDIGTYEGLRNYITQYYTYLTQTKSYINSSQSGSIIDIVPKVDGKDVQIQIVSKVLGVTQEVKATMTEQGLDPKFREALANLLKNRYKNVQLTNPARNIVGVNKTGKFNEAIFDGEKWTKQEYDNYNMYVLKDAETRLTPVHNQETDDGSVELKGRSGKSWLYAMNPVTKFSTNALLQNVPKPEPTGVDVNQPPAKTVGYGENAVAKTESESTVTMDQLRKLRDSVPVKDRTGDSLVKIFRYYKKNNLNIIEGANPFDKNCK